MRRLNNQLKTVLLLGVLSAVLITVGGALGTNALYAATALALLLNVGAYFFSDRLILRLHGAQEVMQSKLRTCISWSDRSNGARI